VTAQRLGKTNALCHGLASQLRAVSGNENIIQGKTTRAFSQLAAQNLWLSSSPAHTRTG